MHVLDVKWFLGDDGLYRHGIQAWIDEAERPVTRVLERGETITWTLVGPRRCIGYRDGKGRLQKCPERSFVKRGQKRCGPCSAMDLYDECVFCDGSICRASPERRDHCRNTNYSVYAVVFGDGTLKVGVSVRNRLLTRWLEQGADFGAVLAEIQDGKIARRIEHRLSQDKNAAKAVRFGRKVDALTTTMDLAEAERRVQAIHDNAVLSGIIGVSGSEQRDLGVESLDPYYGLPKIESVPGIWPEGRVKLQGQQVLGEVIGMKGPLLVVETGRIVTAINLKKLVGYTLDEEREVNYFSQSSLLEHL
ncbi:DUF2797 domain-containing protein [Candidatus Thorarchaeota archaeon]|nr:MAG: DUF2797 domain-containing protein [Candidatus Thorarchaeota archaeon]